MIAMAGFSYPRRGWTSLLVLLVLAGSGISVFAGEAWPGGGSIAEGSRSPDGRFAVLLPSREAALPMEEADTKNFLVDLKTRTKLCVIRGAHFYPFRNHRDLKVVWADDSSWCVVTYVERFGFKSITLLVARKSGWDQTDLGSHIAKSLDAEIARQAGGARVDAFAAAQFRVGGKENILVTADSTTNPKQIPDFPNYSASFEGVFDVRKGRWVSSQSRGGGG